MADTFKAELSGVVSFKMGDVGADGTMGSSLTQYTGVKDGTMTFDIAAPSVNDILIEESDTPYSTQLQGQAKSFTLELLNLKLSDLVAFAGGTFTAGTGGSKDTWTAPTSIANIIQSVEVVSRDSDLNEVTYNYHKCRVSSYQSQTNTKTDLIGLQVSFNILQPTTDAGVLTPPRSIEGETIT